MAGSGLFYHLVGVEYSGVRVSWLRSFSVDHYRDGFDYMGLESSTVKKIWDLCGIWFAMEISDLFSALTGITAER